MTSAIGEPLQEYGAGVIAATKLEIPPSRDELVPRAALVSLLAGARHTRVSLLSAPAGCGKTTLLQQWHRAVSVEQPFAWLSLDEADDDRVRFWTGVIESLRRVEPGIGARAEGALRSPAASLEDVVVPLLINELTALPRRIVLVLDDLHVVRDERIHGSLGVFVERLPATLHLAVATRTDPPWPMLPRLRARDEVVELRSADLRFSAEEAGSYLTSMGLELEPDQVAWIRRRTEGWAAALQLAGLTLRGRERDVDLAAALSGEAREIGDYLTAEVLDRVSAEDRAFLLRTSILERMAPDLCDAVLQRGGSDVRLAELDRRNLFVVPLDSRRRWYRYHHLFADVLRARLYAEEPGAHYELHRRAAAWLADHGESAEAIDHMIAAGEVDRTAELVAANWLPFFNRGWLMTVRRWLDALPPERLSAHPQLWLARAWTLLDLGALDEVAAWLDQAPQNDDWADVLRAVYQFKVGDLAAASAAAHAAAVGRVDDGRFRPTTLALITGVTAFWRGRYAEARFAFQDASAIAAEAHNQLARQYAIGYLALDAAEHEHPAAAQRLLAESHDLADDDPQVSEHFTAMVMHLAWGRAAELAGHLPEAERELARAGELSRRGAGVVERAAASLSHARVLAALGRRDAARTRLADARALLSACADPGTMTRALAQAERAPGLAPPRAQVAAGAELTERELSILRVLDSEMSLRDISGELFVSLNTVKTHTRNIYLKLGVGSREEAVARARELALL
jgi:LuxR family maltose regulon positive regulatory protein